jgi:DnaK suppressor protein
MALTKPELRKLKALLAAKQEELARGLSNRVGIAIEKAADAIDEVQLAGEREFAITNLDRESNLLRNVRAAVQRMDENCYGMCLHCEQEINPKRLAAVPWAAYCLKCQEVADGNSFEAVETFETSRLNR